MKRETDSYITVYLSLILAVLLSLIFIMLEGVRGNTIKAEIESVMDLSLYSIFAEYNRELLEQYELFAIDTSYGESSGNLKNTQEHLQYYMNENFHKDEIIGIISYRDLTALNCDNTSIREYCLLSDEKGSLIKEQIVDYMKYKKGSILADKFLEKYSSIENSMNDTGNMDEEWNKAENEIADKIQLRDDSWSEEKPPPGIDNPSSHIKSIKEEGALLAAFPQEKSISAMVITPSFYYSGRKVRKGTGRMKDNTSIIDRTMGRIYLQEYLFEKCGSFIKEKNNSLLKYQIEYIICGEDSDLGNLEEITDKIMIIRQGINLAYLLTDAGRQQEAEALALLISTSCLLPELKDVVKTAIIFAWSYAESLQDLRILLDGKKAATVKSDATWNVPLSHILNFTSTLSQYKSSDSGLGYEDYLGFFLYTMGEADILTKFMDICEMDVRITEGNGNFQVDGCIVQLKAEASVSSKFQQGYSISRNYYY